MAYIGLPPKANFTSGLLDRFTSTTGTTVTLTHDISSENDIVVFVNFVKQDSTTYSVGGTGNKTLTLGGTLVSSDIVEVHYLNIVGQTVNPSANSVGSSQLTADSITGQTAETSIADDDTIIIHDTSASSLKKMTKANFISGVGGTNTPAFRAYKSSGNQAISAGADTVITFDAESFDTAGNFASNKFTPQTAGKFFLNANLIVSTANDAKFYVIYISKNGTLSAEKWYRPGSTGTIGMSVSTILTANGSSDYFDVQFYGEMGEDIVAGERKTFFEGYKIIE
jgi:hypothetical protein